MCDFVGAFLLVKFNSFRVFGSEAERPDDHERTNRRPETHESKNSHTKLIGRMKVFITREMEGFIEEKIRSGDYDSASEVVCVALRLLKEEDELKRVRLEVVKGVSEVRRGEGITFSSAAELADAVIARRMDKLER